MQTCATFVSGLLPAWKNTRVSYGIQLSWIPPGTSGSSCGWGDKLKCWGPLCLLLVQFRAVGTQETSSSQPLCGAGN